MKLFAYEHPSGPVHEVEVLGRHGALAASETVKCVDAFAAPSRARVQVLQLKSKIEQAMRTSA